MGKKTGHARKATIGRNKKTTGDERKDQYNKTRERREGTTKNSVL